MTVFNSVGAAIAAAGTAATLLLGAGAASAATVQVTIDFGSGDLVDSLESYTEDGFQLTGSNLFLDNQGQTPRAIFLDLGTPSLTLSRVGGGAFSLLSFDYSCNGACDFSVGSTVISGSGDLSVLVTLSPTGITGVTSLVFASPQGLAHLIDNIVLEYDDDLTPIPVPAALPLLLAGIGGLGLMARRRSRAG